MLDNAQKIAQILLESKAVHLNVTEPFTFASGIKSPIYCDNRFILGFPKFRDLVIQAFLSNPQIQEAEVIAGTSTAGIAWAAIIADHLNKPLAYVRAEAKAHGAGKTVEGAEVAHKKTVVIEDLISTGGSSKKVVDNLIQAQAEVTAVVAIFTYQFEGITELFAQTPLYTLSDFSTLIELASQNKLIGADEYTLAKKWNQSPKQWP